VKDGKFMGFGGSSRIVQYLDVETQRLKQTPNAYFNKYTTRDSRGDLTPGSAILRGTTYDGISLQRTLAIMDTPLMDAPIIQLELKLPGLPAPVRIKIAFDDGYFMPYKVEVGPTSSLYHQFPPHHQHNVWIVTIANDQPINASKGVMDVLNVHRSKRSGEPIGISISKCKADARTKLATYRAAFQQTEIPNMVLSTDPIAQSVTISMPIKPTNLKSLTTLKESDYTPQWMQSQFEHYMKMYRSGSHSIPMLRDDIPEGRSLLNSLVRFYSKPVPNLKHMWELRSQWVTDCNKE